MPVPLFDVNNYILDYIPRTKRKPYFVAWFKGLLSQIDRLNRIFNDYRNGSTDLGYWSNVISYSSGNRVRTLFGTFESLINSNLANDPLLDDGTKWIKVLNSFIGSDERISYTAQKLNMEYNLNRVFTGNGAIYRTPTSINPGIGYLPLSDIYITNVVPAYTSFCIFSSESGSSAVYSGISSGFIFSTEVYGTFTTFRFAVNIPSAVYSSIDSNPAIAETIVRSVVDKYRLEGTFYDIITY
jgi:hypothetical protein